MDGSGSNAGTGTGDLVDDFLEHFGVKGMHWGVRRNRVQGPSSSDAQTATQVHEKISQNGGIHALTNKELQDFITRANLEQQYSRLAQQDPNLVKGHNFIKAALGVGQTANNVYNLYNSPLSKKIRKAIEKKRGG